MSTVLQVSFVGENIREFRVSSPNREIILRENPTPQTSSPAHIARYPGSSPEPRVIAPTRRRKDRGCCLPFVCKAEINQQQPPKPTSI